MSTPLWTGLTALVVEDSVVQRKHMVDLLRQLGFGEVLEAGDGNEALEVLDGRQASVFLVLTDLEMPGMDGIELTRQLIERDVAQNLIVASARDPRLLEIIESMGLENATLGLLGTVLKPVRLDDLSTLLERVGHTRGPRALKFDRRAVDETELEGALERGEFVAWFQPKVSMQTGFIKGVEALARWQHPEHGLLSPLYFIEALEGSRLMPRFTLQIVEQVLQQIKLWQQGGLPGITVSINLSADVLDNRGFIDQLDTLVQSHGVVREALIWEVTETMVMKNISQSLANLGRLRLMGFGLAMDDYGIGYSSMQQLSRCPFSELKIDRVFVDGASKRPNRQVVLESAIQLGQRLDITTVAEGVETVADWQLLRAMGCELAQGYLVAKPMPAGEIVTWVRNNHRRLRRLAGGDEVGVA
jgi:EAL domain-containing protein (putative c-di-GMP-specific phosphodiesterase class I)/FixJ family two-component response regulator